LAKKKNTTIPETKFRYEHSMQCDGFEITRGDLIKISGEYGLRFKFESLATNVETGATWVDCFEIFRGRTHSYRSFNIDRVKRIPQRGKRGRRVVQPS
jgi:hypothetical protein